MARPKIRIDWGEFDKLCYLQCTQTEVAYFFNCSVDTIDRARKRERKKSFAEYYKTKQSYGSIALRRTAMHLALGDAEKNRQPDTKVLLYLLKSKLGNTAEEPEEDVVDGNLEITYKTKWGSLDEPSQPKRTEDV